MVENTEISSNFNIQGKLFNPLSPNNDLNLISPHNITDWSNIQVTRMNKMINKDEMSWSLKKFSQVVLYEICGEQWGEYACWYRGLKGSLRGRRTKGREGKSWMRARSAIVQLPPSLPFVRRPRRLLKGLRHTHPWTGWPYSSFSLFLNLAKKRRPGCQLTISLFSESCWTLEWIAILTNSWNLVTLTGSVFSRGKTIFERNFEATELF